MNIKNNQRFRNMDTKLKAAVLELLKEMDFDKITVKMICKKAEVNRSTFYAHYADIYDVIDGRTSERGTFGKLSRKGAGGYGSFSSLADYSFSAPYKKALLFL